MENDKVIKGQSWKRLQALHCLFILLFFFLIFFVSFSVILLVFFLLLSLQPTTLKFFTLDVDVVVIIVVVIVIIYMLFGFTALLFVCLLFLAKRVE